MDLNTVMLDTRRDSDLVSQGSLFLVTTGKAKVFVNGKVQPEEEIFIVWFMLLMDQLVAQKARPKSLQLLDGIGMLKRSSPLKHWRSVGLGSELGCTIWAVHQSQELLPGDVFGASLQILASCLLFHKHGLPKRMYSVASRASSEFCCYVLLAQWKAIREAPVWSSDPW